MTNEKLAAFVARIADTPGLTGEALAVLEEVETRLIEHGDDD